MKKIFLIAALLTVGVFAVQVNDLAPDYGNAITDDGFWDTTGHSYVVVAEASSDPSVYGAIETRVASVESVTLQQFDSRETTTAESGGLARFSSMPVGVIVSFR